MAWEHREAEQVTTTFTVTPVGFTLSRYSHRAPREGRSLSTAALQEVADKVADAGGEDSTASHDVVVGVVVG